jgi:hypothetical protein
MTSGKVMSTNIRGPQTANGITISLLNFRMIALIFVVCRISSHSKSGDNVYIEVVDTSAPRLTQVGS